MLEPPIPRERDALIVLLNEGADVRAIDDLGRSVSHVVYDDMPNDALHGSYRRDLWDAVLAICGYNVLEIRGDFRRVGRYARQRKYGGRHSYTKQDFRSLWNGWEEKCPYPEDLEGTATGADGCDSEHGGPDEDGDLDDIDPGDDNADKEDSGDVSDEDDDSSFFCPDPNCDFCATSVICDSCGHSSIREREQAGSSTELESTHSAELQNSPTSINSAQFEAMSISSEAGQDEPELAGQSIWREEQVQDTGWEALAIFDGRWETLRMDSENPWEDTGSAGLD